MTQEQKVIHHPLLILWAYQAAAVKSLAAWGVGPGWLR